MTVRVRSTLGPRTEAQEGSLAQLVAPASRQTVMDILDSEAERVDQTKAAEPIAGWRPAGAGVP